MFPGWENFYLIVGPSAGALIGLMFVVVTLTAGRERDQTEQGKHLYTSPIVWHLAVVVLLSGAAVAPAIGAKVFGVLTAGVALLGILLGIRSTVGIARRQLTGPENNMFDTWWYGIIPLIVYIGLAGAAVAVLVGSAWSAEAVAAALMALLMVSVHAEWDLVTFLAAIADPSVNPSERSTKS
jgi:hypothetical protein